MIVALVNLKGGVGKTTSALYFAAVAEERGDDPVVLDADNERSAFEWGRAGELPFEVLAAKRDGLARQARALERAGRPGIIARRPTSGEVLWLPRPWRTGWWCRSPRPGWT